MTAAAWRVAIFYRDQAAARAVPMGNVHLLQFFELRQQPSGVGSVVTVSLELRDSITLLAYVSLANRNMPLCLFQVQLSHLPIDRGTKMKAMSFIFFIFFEAITDIRENHRRK